MKETNIDALWKKLWEAVQKIIEAIKEIVRRIVQAVRQMLDRIVPKLRTAALIMCQNKRLIHLAKYHKKSRVRKKNRHRLMRLYARRYRSECRDGDSEEE